MRKLLPVKFFCWLLLLVIMTAVTHGACQSAHASLGDSSVTADQFAQSEISASDHCPCCPVQHDNEHGVCDSCINCICHAGSIVQQLQLSYSPLINDLQTFHPDRQLPEVYLLQVHPPAKPRLKRLSHRCV